MCVVCIEIISLFPDSQISVMMGSSGSLALLALQCLDGWRSASMRPGEPSVIHSGPMMMETSPADSSDSPREVCGYTGISM